MSDQNRPLGLAAAFGMIFVWSGFIVFSRAGVQTALTPYDVTALRFLVSAAITLPFAVLWWPRTLAPWKQMVIAVCGPGILYTQFMYHGLTNASAAYGGVFANGSLPVFALLIMALALGQRPTLRQVLAVAIIVAGGILLAWRGLSLGGADVVTGIALFLGASLVLVIYIVGLGHWGVTPKEALVLVNLPNALIYLPVWLLALPTGVHQTPIDVLVFQALFQGLGPGFLVVILLTLTSRHLGAAVTSGLSAVVPATATVLAIPVLGEIPGPVQGLGIAVVTLGLILLVWRR